MPKHHVVRMLPYKPREMFELVGQVERYPEFVPWITSLRTWNEHEEGEGIDVLDAESTVGFKMLREKFATRVRRDANTNTIEVSLLHGPFKRLNTRWRFDDHAMGTKATFDIDFAFKSMLLDAMLAANFDRAVNPLMARFEARAAKLYKPTTKPG